MNIRNGLNFAKKVLSAEECDLLVLDEILGAVGEGIISEAELLHVLESRSPSTDVILAGRVLPPKIAEQADVILNIVPEKQ